MRLGIEKIFLIMKVFVKSFVINGLINVSIGIIVFWRVCFIIIFLIGIFFVFVNLIYLFCSILIILEWINFVIIVIGFNVNVKDGNIVCLNVF